MKKLTLLNLSLSIGYVIVLIQSIRAMHTLLTDTIGYTALLVRLGIIGMWSLLLLFCGAFLYQLIKHESNE